MLMREKPFSILFELRGRLRLNSPLQVKGRTGLLPQRQALTAPIMEVEMDLKRLAGRNWKKAAVLASAAIIGVVVLSGSTEAQVTPQTIELAKIDVQKLSAGYRASKVIGSSVVNDANEFIGKIDDLFR